MTDVHTKAKQGIKLLMGRQVFLQGLTFLGGIVLARVLGPAQFGLYAIASFLVSAFALFGDFGLAPSLIQRKEQLTDVDLRVAFTLQQTLTTLIVVILFALAPWLAHFYPKAPPETVWLVRALAFNLYLSSWRTMSALQLERHLKYDKLAMIEVVESLTYQSAAVLLAITGHGVWSYVFAVLASGLLGTILVYGASPWQIRFAYDHEKASAILKFGVPFQIQAITNSVGGWVTPILVGSMIGPQAVGYLTWASSNGKKPLILVDNVMRVAFPHFSRIQDDPEEVQRTIVSYLTWLLIPSGLWFAVILVSGPALVKLIYLSKWVPAVPALTLCAAALGIDVIHWVVVVSLNSLGKVNFVTRMILFRNIISIVFAVVFVYIHGFIGVPLGYIVASILMIPWTVQGLGKGRLQQITRALLWLVIPLLVAIGLSEWAEHLVRGLAVRLVISLATVILSYFTMVWLASPDSIRNSIRQKIASTFNGMKTFAK